MSFQAVADYYQRMLTREAKAATAAEQQPAAPIQATAPLSLQTGTPRRSVPPAEADPLAGAGLD